jgi:hypothetical protein
MIGSSQALVADVAASDLDELATEMARVRCLEVKMVEVDSSFVDFSALIPVNRVQMIASREEV